MTRGRPDGVRVAGAARRRPRLLRRHPRRAPDRARAARRTSSRATARLGIEESNPLNAITEADARRARGELGLPVFTGMKHWTPRIAEAAERGARDRRRHGRRPRARAALLARSRSPATATSSRRRSRAAPRLVFVESWHDEPGLRRAPRRPHPRHGRARRLHRALAARAHPRRGRPVPGPAARDGRGSSPRAAGVDDWSFSFQSESPTGEPWLGPDILDHLAALHERGVDDVLVCPVGFVVRSSRDPLGHRHRGAGEGAPSSGCALERIEMPNADPALRRTSRRDRPAARSRGTAQRRVRARPRSSSTASRSASASPARAHRTLKDLVVARGRARRRPRSGRCATSRSRSSRARRSGSSAATAPGKTTLLRLDLGDHQADRRDASRSAAASARCSSSAPASIPTSPAARTST